MRLTSKTDYGLRALIDLALHASGLPVQSHDIATRQGIPESYLNQLLILLRRAGLIRSLRGPQGGHQLARPPRAISIADIVAALDGPTAAEDAKQPGDRRGNDAATDLVVRAAWGQVNAAISDALGRITLDTLIQERQRHDTAAMFQI
ncbi:MAG: Rrf2 family transcriptional regulator [Thermomicrobia bacterium]|nr:Rrf2 family transcriptional regulator [Thermomicrobia bacterium]